MTTAIILRTKDYGEADQLVVFFSKELGRITGIAKNARKSRWRFAGHLESLSLTEMRLRPRKRDGLVWIEESCVLDGRLDLRRDIHKVAWAQYFVELTCVFVPEAHPDPAVYDFLLAFVHDLETSTPTPVMLLLDELRFLGLLGYGPRFDSCPLCGKELAQGHPAYFNARAGGACHLQCVNAGQEEYIMLSPAALAVARRAPVLDRVSAARIRLNRHALGELRSALSTFVRSLRGGELHTLSFMEKLASSSIDAE
ncbi:MAG: DNA repair protein RecO [Desulfomonilaceae bacterium]